MLGIWCIVLLKDAKTLRNYRLALIPEQPFLDESLGVLVALAVEGI